MAAIADRRVISLNQFRIINNTNKHNERNW